jgi:plastocyanin
MLGLGAAAMLVLAAGVGYRTVSAGGGGCHEPVSDGTGTTVDLKNNCFMDTVLHVDEGATVTWTNADSWQHTVTSAGANQPGGWGDFEPLEGGQTVAHTFENNGVYPYFCLFHPSMIGAIVVGDGSGAGPAAAAAGSVMRDAGRGSGVGSEMREAESGSPSTGGPGGAVVAGSIGGGAAAVVVAFGLVYSRLIARRRASVT